MGTPTQRQGVRLRQWTSLDQYGKKAIIGQDSIDWKACITACREVGGTEWYVLEQESYPDGKPAMECTDMSLAGLKKILAEMRQARAASRPRPS